MPIRLVTRSASESRRPDQQPPRVSVLLAGPGAAATRPATLSWTCPRQLTIKQYSTTQQPAQDKWRAGGPGRRPAVVRRAPPPPGHLAGQGEAAGHVDVGVVRRVRPAHDRRGRPATQRWTVRRTGLRAWRSCRAAAATVAGDSWPRGGARQWFDVPPGAMRIEGLVCKGVTSRYVGGRREWLKWKSVGVSPAAFCAA